ncbi:hypothetical protein ACOSP7_013430 [Xanthoceras sorbifolium]
MKNKVLGTVKHVVIPLPETVLADHRGKAIASNALKEGGQGRSALRLSKETPSSILDSDSEVVLEEILSTSGIVKHIILSELTDLELNTLHEEVPVLAGNIVGSASSSLIGYHQVRWKHLSRMESSVTSDQTILQSLGKRMLGSKIDIVVPGE